MALMLGYSPGTSVLAEKMIEIHPDHTKFDQHPTGATLVADFDIATWQDADWGKANAQHFKVPRDL